MNVIEPIFCVLVVQLPVQVILKRGVLACLQETDSCNFSIICSPVRLKVGSLYREKRANNS